MHAFEEAIAIIEQYTGLTQPSVSYEYRDAEGAAATEAPRGMIYHRYEVNQDGTVSGANIVPPTSQNQIQMESDLRQFLPDLLSQPDESVALECEKLIRTYDPCISCSTHFLKLNIERV